MVRVTWSGVVNMVGMGSSVVRVIAVLCLKGESGLVDIFHGELVSYGGIELVDIRHVGSSPFL
jgi:hypothetical protein